MTVLTTSFLPNQAVYPTKILEDNAYLYIKRTPHSVVYRIFTSPPPLSVMSHLPHESVDVLEVAVDYFEPEEIKHFE